MARARGGGATIDPVRWAVGLVVLCLVTLVASGVWLTFFAEPPAQAAFSDIEGRSSIDRAASTVHRGATVVSGLSLVAWLAAVWSARPRRSAVPPVLVGILVIGASFLGLLLPWETMGPDAITIGTNLVGFEPVDETVTYVLTDGSTISSLTVWRWFVGHAALGAAASIVTAMAAVAGIRPTRR